MTERMDDVLAFTLPQDAAFITCYTERSSHTNLRKEVSQVPCGIISKSINGVFDIETDRYPDQRFIDCT